MSRLVRRGKVICIVLATLLVSEKLLGVGLVLTQGKEPIDWIKSVVMPLLLCVGFASLGQGDRWLVRLACVYLVLWGGIQLLVAAHVAAGMARVTPPEATLFFVQVVLQLYGAMLLLGIWHVLAGIALVSLPSLRAFFDYQAMSPLQRQFASLLAEEK